MNIVKDNKLGGMAGLVDHGFFGRQGGVSTGVYSALNCGPGSSDSGESVQANRALVAGHFGLSSERLASVWQIHSPDCLYISEPFAKDVERPKADALVTDVPALAIGVLTADCGPVLFTGEKSDGSPVIGAAHAGWGGAVKGVLESTLDVMKKAGANLDTIRAAVGPCIGPASYEVSAGFEKPFLEHHPEDEMFFKPGRKEGHMMFDLPGYIASRLARAGVGQVTITGHDTYKLEDEFFSFRRATHRKEPDYGRQISAIVIKK